MLERGRVTLGFRVLTLGYHLYHKIVRRTIQTYGDIELDFESHSVLPWVIAYLQEYGCSGAALNLLSL
jgi:hypothetical protein